MDYTITTPTVGEVLLEEFMEPYGITAYRLAKDIMVPTSRVIEILQGKRRLTADTSIRLAKYFNVSDSYFLRIQDDIDLRNARFKIGTELDNIPTVIAG